MVRLDGISGRSEVLVLPPIDPLQQPLDATQIDATKKTNNAGFPIFQSYVACQTVKAVIAVGVGCISPPAGIIGIATVAYDALKTNNYKGIRLEVSWAFTLLTEKCRFSQITDQIVLGGMPQQGFPEHLETLDNMGVNAVLSMNEDLEMKSILMPLSKEDWIKNSKDDKFPYLQINAADFNGVPYDQIDQGVEFLHKQIDAKKTTLVHCKAGRGRSVTIVVAYLLVYGLKERKFDSFDEAYQFVKEKRPLINLNSSQRRAVVDYCRIKLEMLDLKREALLELNDNPPNSETSSLPPGSSWEILTTDDNSASNSMPTQDDAPLPNSAAASSS